VITVSVVTVAVLAVLGAVYLVVDALGGDSAPSPGQQAGVTPAVTGAPPSGVRLRDDLTTITVSWADPSAGTVPFVVAGGRAGQPLGALATVERGRTTYTVNGLNSRVDYCFTVLAVYAADSYATSGQACTDRTATDPPR
jgi:hypothetical protein